MQDDEWRNEIGNGVSRVCASSCAEKTARCACITVSGWWSADVVGVKHGIAICGGLGVVAIVLSARGRSDGSEADASGY